MNPDTIINNYVQALLKRAEKSGDNRLEYAMGFLYSTLRNLKLDSYELESLQIDTQTLHRLVETGS